MGRAATCAKTQPVDNMDAVVTRQAGEIQAEEGGAGAPTVQQDEDGGCGWAGGQGVEGVSGAWEVDGAFGVGGCGEVGEEGCLCGVD